jgi:hypothetical protein
MSDPYPPSIISLCDPGICQMWILWLVHAYIRITSAEKTYAEKSSAGKHLLKKHLLEKNIVMGVQDLGNTLGKYVVVFNVSIPRALGVLIYLVKTVVSPTLQHGLYLRNGFVSIQHVH